MEREEAEPGAPNEQIATMAEELRKAELWRDRLEGLNLLMGSYAEGHDMRARLEALHLEQAYEPVERGSEISSSSARRIQPTTLQG